MDKKKVDNLIKLKEKEEERKRRDAEIAAKKKAAGTNDEQDNRLAEGKVSNYKEEDAAGWVRGQNVVKSEP